MGDTSVDQVSSGVLLVLFELFQGLLTSTFLLVPHVLHFRLWTNTWLFVAALFQPLLTKTLVLAFAAPAPTIQRAIDFAHTLGVASIVQLMLNTHRSCSYCWLT